MDQEKDKAMFTPGPWREIPQGDGSKMIAQDYVTGDQMRPKGLRLIAMVMARGNTLAVDEANARLIAAAPDLLDALKIVCACGEPEKVSLYDEEGVEGWRWTHPDGREWTEIGSWDEDPPMHPVAEAALKKATP